MLRNSRNSSTFVPEGEIVSFGCVKEKPTLAWPLTFFWTLCFSHSFLIHETLLRSRLSPTYLQEAVAHRGL